MASVIHATAHGLSAGDAFRFGNVLPTNSGVDETVTYYVLAAGLTLNDFEFSTSPGGTAFILTHDITGGIIRSGDTYEQDDTIVTAPGTPSAPTGLTLSTTVDLDSDGHQIIHVAADLVHATEEGVSGAVVEATWAAGPDWTTKKVVSLPVGTLRAVFTVPGNVTVYVRAYAVTVFGYSSAYTGVSNVTSSKDSSAPGTPANLTTLGGILGIVAKWDKNTELDLAYYEFQYDTSSGFNVSPVLRQLKGNLAVVAGLAAGTWYVRVRAYDTSGNVSAWTSGVSAASRLTGTTDLDPTAVINQATNLINGTATVTVDNAGLHIESGALFIKDEFGYTVLVASGFSGTWSDFLATGLYNGLFLAGTVGTVTNGRTSKLPYWTVADTAGTPTLSFLTGGGVKTTFAAHTTGKKITSDVVKRVQNEDIEFGVAYDIGRTSAGSLRLTVEVENNSAADFSGSSSAGSHDSKVLTVSASESGTLRIATTPAGGPYFRLKITMEEITAHNAANYITVQRTWQLGRGQITAELTAADYLEGPGLVANLGADPIVAITGNESISGDLTIAGGGLSILGTTQIDLYSITGGVERGRITHDGQTCNIGNVTTSDVATVAISFGANATAPLLGFYGTAPVARVTWGAPTTTDTRTTFADTVTLVELAKRVGTLIKDLRALGLLG
jgi:hypothetical protein